MTTIKTAALLFVIVSFIIGCLIIRRSPVTVLASDGSATGPADTFAAHCAECHGRDGRARTAKGKRAGATDFTSDWNRDVDRGIRIITNGKGQMPSFKKKLTAAEIRAVFGYVSRF